MMCCNFSQTMYFFRYGNHVNNRKENRQEELICLSNKTTNVAGVGAGMGKCSSEILAAFGAKVVEADLNQEAAEYVGSPTYKYGGNAMAAVCIVNKDEDLVNLVHIAEKKFGSIEILVNKAGGDGVQTLECYI